MKDNNTRRYQLEEAAAREHDKNFRVAALVNVVSFDKNKMRLTVQPASHRLTDGEYKAPSQVQQVPVSLTRSGGFVIRPWFKQNDFGSVLYCDHDIDKALASGGECKPNTERAHSDNDAVFTGGIIPDGYECPDDIPDGLAFFKEDGSIYFVIAEDKIFVKGDCEWEGDIILTGDLTVNGNITVNGGDVVADGISLKHHVHSGVEPGGGASGEPV